MRDEHSRLQSTRSHNYFEHFWRDFQYGFRNLRREPRFALIAIIALALGIGSMTVIFSVIENVLLNPFPYKDAHLFVDIFVHDPSRPPADLGRPVYTVNELIAIRDQNHVFSDFIASDRVDLLYTNGEGTEQFGAAAVTGNTFNVLGVQPMIGRGLIQADAQPGAPPVVVLSDRLWKKQFGANRDLVGKTIKLNGEDKTLVGVMPPRFLFWGVDAWVPLKLDPGAPENQNRFIFPVGKLKPGVTLEAAAADLNVITHNLARIHPADYPQQFDMRTITLLDGVVGQFKSLIYTLMAAVSLLMLIACSNVANLLLARAAVREKEIAIRASIGASRGRIIRQLLAESFVLATVACFAGCILAYAGLKTVNLIIPADTIPAETVLRLDPNALLFALGVTVLTTVLCGLAPAIHAVRGDLHNRIKDSGKGVGTRSGHGRLRSALVVSEVALSIVLLVGAGLMIRSFVALQRLQLGMDPENVMVTRLPLPKGRYDTGEQKKVFFRQAIQRVSALPGVISVAESSTLPMFGGFLTEVVVPGRSEQDKNNSIFQLCSEGYFPTLRMQLLRGRLMDEADADGAKRVAVINQAFARKYFPNDDPVGRKVKFTGLERFPDVPHDTWFEIIGIVADARNQGLQNQIVPEAFLPYTTTGQGERGLILRTAVEPYSIVNSLNHEIWAVDHSVALTMTGSLRSYVQRFAYAGPKFGFTLLAIFASIGLVLVAIGVFSVMAYSVSIQTHEIGVRMALGAQQANILRMVFKRGLILIALGVLIGELASLGLTRLMASQVFGISARDPLTFSIVIAVIVVVGFMACLFPARRATRVDPIVAFRYA